MDFGFLLSRPQIKCDMSYCKFAPTNSIHQYYHAKEYGFPVNDDNVLFERLALEINQAGLSWELMLKKREGFNKAFKNFDVDKVAQFGARDIERLLKDEGIIRNRLKVLAVINNAKIIKVLQKTHGSFANWIQIHSNGFKEADEQVTRAPAEANGEVGGWVRSASSTPQDLLRDVVRPVPKQDLQKVYCTGMVKLFRKQGFKFVGGEIMKEFLQSVGYLPSPHDKDCPINKEIFKAKVLAIVKAIPKGETMTYGEVAKMAGSPQAARAVGILMKQNKDKQIPCHRVVAQNGLGGYNGLRGPSKEKLLRKERVR